MVFTSGSAEEEEDFDATCSADVPTDFSHLRKQFHRSYAAEGAAAAVGCHTNDGHGQYTYLNTGRFGSVVIMTSDL